MAFDPNTYLSSKQSVHSSGFNPDAYLSQKSAGENQISKTQSALRGVAQGATLGFADEISGGVEALWEKAKGDPTEFGKLYSQYRDESRANFKAAHDANPGIYTTGEVGAGLATTLVPVLNIAKGAKLASVVGKSALTGLLAGTGYSDGETVGEVAKDATISGTLGAVLPVAISKGLRGGQKLLSKGAQNLSETISPTTSKMNTEQIKAAADQLGIKLTPAMLDDAGFIQRLEYTLAESPSFLGQRVARNRKAVTDNLNSTALDLTKDATSMSPYQVGEKFKSGVTAKVGERLDPISSVFNEVADSTKNMHVSDRSKSAITRNIENLDTFKLTAGEGKPRQYVDMISRVENADQVKTMMTLLTQDIKASSGAEKHVLIGIKNKLSNLEKNTIMRAAIKTAKEGGMRESTGKRVGTEIVGDLKDARNKYRALSNDLGELAENTRIKTEKGPTAFLDAVEEIPSERIQDKFFNVENNRQLSNLREKFPEQFDLLRQGKLKDIADASNDFSRGGRGETSSAKFLKEVRALNPEAKQMLFGEASKTIDNLQVLQNALPPNFNPSGSGTQAGWQDAIASNIRDIPLYMMYKGGSTNLAKNVTEKIAKIPDLPQLSHAYQRSSQLIDRPTLIASQSKVSQTPQFAKRDEDEKFLSKEEPNKGPKKWINVGVQKIIEHDKDGSLTDTAVIEKLMKSKKGHDLLNRASDLKPGSKAMDKVVEQIRSGYLNRGDE